MTDIVALPPHPKKGDPDYVEKKRIRQCAYMKEYHARPRIKKLAKERRQVYRACPEYKEYSREQHRIYNARPEVKAQQRTYQLKHKYGLTIKEVDAMIATQNGLCSICGKLPKGKGTQAALHIDHCHKTGKVRAMLCGNCNTALGHAYDDPVLLHKMIDYVEAYQ